MICEVARKGKMNVLRVLLSLSEYKLFSDGERDEIYLPYNKDGYDVFEVHLVPPEISFARTIIVKDFELYWWRWGGEDAVQRFRTRHSLKLSEYDGFDSSDTRCIVKLFEQGEKIAEREPVRSEKKGYVAPLSDVDLFPRVIEEKEVELRKRYIEMRQAEMDGRPDERLEARFNTLFEEVFRCKFLVRRGK